MHSPSLHDHGTGWPFFFDKIPTIDGDDSFDPTWSSTCRYTCFFFVYIVVSATLLGHKLHHPPNRVWDPRDVCVSSAHQKDIVTVIVVVGWEPVTPVDPARFITGWTLSKNNWRYLFNTWSFVPVSRADDALMVWFGAASDWWWWGDNDRSSCKPPTRPDAGICNRKIMCATRYKFLWNLAWVGAIHKTLIQFKSHRMPFLMGKDQIALKLHSLQMVVQYWIS